MSELELTTALRALGARLEETPDLVGAVVRRLEHEPIAARPARRRPRRLLVVALALLLLVSATAIASSRTVRDWLLDRGVDARPVATLPGTLGSSLDDLGVRIDPGAATEVFGQPLPSSSRLGRPAAIRSDRRGSEVTLVWAERPELPASRSFPGVGALLTVWPDGADDDPVIVAKALAAETEVRFVNLADGAQAIWISGAPHAVKVFDRSTMRFRLAANVLIWSAGGLNRRLETTVPLDRALELAESFEPSP